MANTTIYPYGEYAEAIAGFDIVNDLISGGSDRALSAEMGKELKKLIDFNTVTIIDSSESNTVLAAPSVRQIKLIRDNIMTLYNNLASIAFVGDKPTLDWIGNINQYILRIGTISNLALNNPIVDINGNSIVDGQQVNEGNLRLILKPISPIYTFTNITVNNQSIAFTETEEDDGSVYVDIIVSSDINIAAEAVPGYAIDFTNSTGCSINLQGIAVGKSLNAIITADQHYTLPSDIIIQINGEDIAHRYIRTQDRKSAVLTASSIDITGDLTIICNAVEDTYVTLNLTSVDEHTEVTNVTDNNNDTKIYTENDKILRITPSAGHKFTSNGTPTSNVGTMSGNGVYNSYELLIPANSTGSITISAATALKEIKQVLWNNVDVKAYITEDLDTEITSPQSITENDSFEIWFVPNVGWQIDSIQEISNATIQLSNGVGHIYIEHVISDTSISMVVSNQLTLMYKGVWYEKTSGSGGYLHIGDLENRVVSPMLDLGESREEPIDITFTTGSTVDSTLGIIHFDESLQYIDASLQTDTIDTISIPVTTRYVRLMTKTTEFSNSYIECNNTTLWNGSNNSIDSAMTNSDFLNSIFAPQPNENEDYEHCCYIRANVSANNLSYNRTINSQTGNNAKNSNWSKVFTLGNVTAIPWVMSKEFKITDSNNSAQQIAYYVGQYKDSDSNMPNALLRNSSKTEFGYFGFEQSDKNDNGTKISTTGGVRTKTWDSKWAYCRLMVDYTKYKNPNINMYAKILSTGELLWGRDNS